MQWMVPQPRLGSEQREILNACQRPTREAHWIKGFAGSGKTVLIVHAMNEVRLTEPSASMCFVTFTHALKDLVRSGFSDLIQDVPVMTYHAFQKRPRRYDYIFVDEVQDLPPDVINLLRRNADRIIVAGDADQSIYDEGVSGQEIVALMSPRLHQLQTLYRITGRIRDIARVILPGSLIETARMGRMQDVEVVLAKALDETAEYRWVWTLARRFAATGDPSVVILPNHGHIYRFVAAACRDVGIDPPPPPERINAKRDYERTNAALREAGLPLTYLGNGYGSLQDSDERPLTYVMTYHSAKGLDFASVFLPSLNHNTSFWASNPDRERRLLYVGITRSRKDLFLSYSGSQPHHLIRSIPESLLKQIECPVDDENADDEFIPF